MEKCVYYVSYSPSDVADQNELTIYQNRFTKGIGKKIREQKFSNRITEFYYKNVFNSEMTPQQNNEVSKQKQSLGTTIMENIEYLLNKLKNVDIDKYNEYNKTYQDALNNQEITFRELTPLEGELEFYLMTGKRNSDNLVTYLENTKINYLEHILNNTKLSPELTIKDIDKYEELFLKVKNKYPLGIQRKALKDLAFIYLMKIYLTIDDISEEELKNSYFVDNLKTILIIIESLRDLSIIKNNIIVDLDNDINLNNLLNIIRKIEFNKSKEKVTTLIRKI